MDRHTIEADIKKYIDSGRSSRISFKSADLRKLSAMHDELEKQCEQLKEELRELKSRRLSRRRTI